MVARTVNRLRRRPCRLPIVRATPTMTLMIP
jgi:hypothetical protein